MPYVIRLRRNDGSVVNLPEVYRDATPQPDAEIALHMDGILVRVKVERHSRWHAIAPDEPVHPVDLVIARQLDNQG